MAGKLTVRLATSGDRDAWEPLWRAWQDHMGGSVPPEVTARSWQRMTTEASGICCMMAFDGSAAVGFAILSRSFFAWTGEDILYLQDLFVSPEARGKGIGAALIEAIYAHADATGAPQVFWMVDEDDAALRRFYDRTAKRSPYLRYLRLGWPW
jgi:GNAT superfamily N-acetyltransferase